MPSLEDERFAKIAAEKTFVNAEQLQTAIKVQEQTMLQGQIKSLADILAEQGALSVTQVAEVSDAAQQAGPLKIGEFQIIRKLGEGGMGAVYHAKQTSLDREVALKLLPANLARNADLVARFKREAQVSAKLDHPNIVRGLALGEEKGQHYFAMEFVRGQGLDKVIEREGAMPIDRAVGLIRQACLGLKAAHDAGVIHRDIKPANIMITEEGVVKIADLGLVKQADDESTRLTVTGSGMGTPSYMPPEQAKSAKHVDARSDIYALGVTFYHMLTGDLPFKGETAYEVIQAHEQGKYKSPKTVRPEVSGDLSLVVEKMMAKKPEHRFQNCGEIIEALDRTTGSAAAEIAAQVKPAAAPTPEAIWYIRATKDGQEKLYKTEEATLKALIRQGKVSRNAAFRRGSTGEFKPLSAFPQLGRLPEAGAATPVPRDDGEKRGHPKLREFYTQIETNARHRAKMKKLKRILVRYVLPVVVIGALAIAGLKYKDQIMPLIKQLTG